MCEYSCVITEDKAIIIKTMKATTPELDHVGFWSPKSSSFSGSDSIVVEEAARNFLSPRPSIKQPGAPNFFVQHDKVEDSKLRRYLETCGRALEQFLQRQTSSNDSIAFLLGMAFDRLVRGRTSLGERRCSIEISRDICRYIIITRKMVPITGRASASFSSMLKL